MPATPCDRLVDPARSCLARDQLQAEAVRRSSRSPGGGPATPHGATPAAVWQQIARP